LCAVKRGAIECGFAFVGGAQVLALIAFGADAVEFKAVLSERL
jgi:hypothetical protein